MFGGLQRQHTSVVSGTFCTIIAKTMPYLYASWLTGIHSHWRALFTNPVMPPPAPPWKKMAARYSSSLECISSNSEGRQQQQQYIVSSTNRQAGSK
jgi:hypothetical protein